MKKGKVLAAMTGVTRTRTGARSAAWFLKFDRKIFHWNYNNVAAAQLIEFVTGKQDDPGVIP